MIASKAVAFKEALEPGYKEYQIQVVKNANRLAEELLKRDFKLVSGGTDNHLVLIDLTNKNITGKEAEKKLDEVYITANKNTIPYDPNGALVTSGIRIGTPAVTTRGMIEEDMVDIAEAIDLCLTYNKKLEARELVVELTNKYPLYEGYSIFK